jgi:hypothetical protein
MAQHSPEPRKPTIVIGGGGSAKRPLGSTSQRDLVRASLLLCPSPRDERREDGDQSGS